MTSITVGRPERLEGKFPSMSSTMCQPGSKSLGSITLVPSGDADEEFAIRVVTGIAGVSPDDCVNDGNKGCIVARRSLRYLPNRKLFLPIPMYAECRGIYCDPGTTCHRAGVCRPASIENSELCTTAGACGPDALPREEKPDPNAGTGGMPGGAGTSGAGMAGVGGMAGAGMAGAGMGGMDSAGGGGVGMGGAGEGSGGAGAGGGAGASGGVNGGAAGTSGSGAGGGGASGAGSAGGSGAGTGGVGGVINGVGTSDADVEKAVPACTIIELSGYPSSCYNPANDPTEPGIKIKIEIPLAAGGAVNQTISIPGGLQFSVLYDTTPNVLLTTTIEFPPGAPASCLANTLPFANPASQTLGLGVIRFGSGAPWGGVDFPRFPAPDGPLITASGVQANQHPCQSYVLYQFVN